MARTRALSRTQKAAPVNKGDDSDDEEAVAPPGWEPAGSFFSWQPMYPEPGTAAQQGKNPVEGVSPAKPGRLKPTQAPAQNQQ